MAGRYAPLAATGASRGAARYGAGMPEFALPRSDEPFDFRHQAAEYSLWRRDYSPALYEAITDRTGAPDGGRALDVGCGTGFVTTSLARLGWTPIGIDFSAPMLAEARVAGGGALRLVRARGETLPMRDGEASLVTCGTSFHWLAPVPALVEFRRVLAPGGWVALFWRYASPGEPSTRLVVDVLKKLGVVMSSVFEEFRVHPSDPFSGSGFEEVTTVVLHPVLSFTAEEFHGYVSTVEWIRRFAGSKHQTFLARLRAELAAQYPQGFEEKNDEYLFLARRPA
jgi:ubiquinone/menaquinone biosynthesis C-methylase UbiE